MRILVVGAGAIGGYFGGRLAQAGRDVTFLVRPRRAAELARTGLVIKSPAGDAVVPQPRTVTADALREPFDLVLLSCKAYDLDGAIGAFAPAVGAGTAILPLLNGMRHLDVLDARFGRAHVLGGECIIAATVDPGGTIVHLNREHQLAFGDRDGADADRIAAIAAVMTGAGFDARVSDAIVQEMWEKWVFLATLAGATCLMRAAVGDIAQAPGGTAMVLGMLEACGAVARASGHPPRAAFAARARAMLTDAGSSLTASMLRDIERGAPIEAEHIVGDLIQRGEEAGDLALLRLAYTHLRAYEIRRQRTAV
jgi:2-dehydropantoate 2-reductase